MWKWSPDKLYTLASSCTWHIFVLSLAHIPMEIGVSFIPLFFFTGSYLLLESFHAGSSYTNYVLKLFKSWTHPYFVMSYPHTQKVLLLLFKVRKRITPLEGWFLILHCFLLSGCMWLKLFKNEKLSPSSTSPENCSLLHISWVPKWKKKFVSTKLHSINGALDQRGRAASGAGAASAAGTHRGAAWLPWKTQAWWQAAGCFCQKPTVVTEHVGKELCEFWILGHLRLIFLWTRLEGRLHWSLR